MTANSTIPSPDDVLTDCRVAAGTTLVALVIAAFTRHGRTPAGGGAPVRYPRPMAGTEPTAV